MKRIKSLIIIYLIILFITLFVYFSLSHGAINDQYFTNCDNCTFAWDYDFDNQTDVVGFRLFYTNLSTNIKQVITIPEKVKSYIFKHFPSGSHSCYMIAYDLYGNESDSSNVIQVNKKTIKPGIPTSVYIVNPAFTIIFDPKK